MFNLCQHTWKNLSRQRGDTNVGLVLVQRRRRWTNTKPTLEQCLLLAGRTHLQTGGGELFNPHELIAAASQRIRHIKPILVYSWPSVADDVPTVQCVDVCRIHNLSVNEKRMDTLVTRLHTRGYNTQVGYTRDTSKM